METEGEHEGKRRINTIIATVNHFFTTVFLIEF